MRVLAFFAPVVAVTAAAGDTASTRIVQATIGALVLVGVALALVAVWLVRTTRHDDPVLGPLELMGSRSWRRSDPVAQRRAIDEVRPPGAEPLERMRPIPERDLEFERGPRLGDLSDLAEGDDANDASSAAHRPVTSDEVADDELVLDDLAPDDLVPDDEDPVAATSTGDVEVVDEDRAPGDSLSGSRPS